MPPDLTPGGHTPGEITPRVIATGGGWVALGAEGTLDVYLGRNFVRHVTELCAEGSPQIVLDLSGVEAVAPSGFGALITCLRITREAGGDFRLANVRAPLLDVFHRHQIDRIFRLHESVPEAIAGGQPSTRSIARRRRHRSGRLLRRRPGQS